MLRREPSKRYADLIVPQGGHNDIAIDLLLKGETGRMTALHNGRYTTVAIKSILDGTKRVDVTELYDTENYRPKVTNMLNKPMFLY